MPSAHKESEKERFSDYAASALRQGEEKIHDAVSEAEKKIKQGEKQLHSIASAVEKQLSDNPWPIVAGVAAGCLFLGFVMGLSKR